MTKYVAFLRAINVGGHNVVKMEKLRKIFVYLGFTNVSTYLQSGNILFEIDVKDLDLIKSVIEDKLHTFLDDNVVVCLRTVSEIQEIVKLNPFEDYSDSKHCFVTFLSGKPSKKFKLPFNSEDQRVQAISMKHDSVFSVSFLQDGRYGAPNEFIELTLDVSATTRSWSSLKGLLENALRV